MEDNLAFAEKFAFPFDLLSDTDQSVGKAYGAFNPERPEYASRKTYVIGPEGTLTHVFEKVDPKTEAGTLIDLLTKS